MSNQQLLPILPDQLLVSACFNFVKISGLSAHWQCDIAHSCPHFCRRWRFKFKLSISLWANSPKTNATWSNLIWFKSVRTLPCGLGGARFHVGVATLSRGNPILVNGHPDPIVSNPNPSTCAHNFLGEWFGVGVATLSRRNPIPILLQWETQIHPCTCAHH